MSKVEYAWYSAPGNNRLSNGDNRVIAIGRTHEVKGLIILCRKGLHASKYIRNAIAYGYSNNIYRVKLDGAIKYSYDKMCATKRTYLGHLNYNKVSNEYKELDVPDISFEEFCLQKIKEKYPGIKMEK